MPLFNEDGEYAEYIRARKRREEQERRLVKEQEELRRSTAMPFTRWNTRAFESLYEEFATEPTQKKKEKTDSMKQFDNNDLVKLYSVVGPAPDGASIADFLNNYRKQVKDIMETFHITFNTAFDMLLDKERKRRRKNKFITFDFDEVVKVLPSNLICQECGTSSTFLRAVLEKKWTLARIKEEFSDYTPTRIGIHLLDNNGAAQLYQAVCAPHLQRINQLPPTASDVEKLFSVEPFKSMRETYDRVRSQ